MDGFLPNGVKVTTHYNVARDEYTFKTTWAGITVRANELGMRGITDIMIELQHLHDRAMKKVTGEVPKDTWTTVHFSSWEDTSWYPADNKPDPPKIPDNYGDW